MSLRLQQEYQSLCEDSMSTYIQPPRFVDAIGGLNMQVPLYKYLVYGTPGGLNGQVLLHEFLL